MTYFRFCSLHSSSFFSKSISFKFGRTKTERILNYVFTDHNYFPFASYVNDSLSVTTQLAEYMKSSNLRMFSHFIRLKRNREYKLWSEPYICVNRRSTSAQADSPTLRVTTSAHCVTLCHTAIIHQHTV